MNTGRLENREENGFGATEVAEIVGISLRQLYYWEGFGVIKPFLKKCGDRKFRRYSLENVEVLKRIKKFLKKGFMLDKAIEKAINHNGNDGSNGEK